MSKANVYPRKRPINSPSVPDSKVETLSETEKENLLDFTGLKDQPVSKYADHVPKHPDEVPKLVPNHGENLDSNTDEELEVSPKNDEWQPRPRMNLPVGFLRLANYVCCVTVIFGVFVSIFYPYNEGPSEEMDLQFWQDLVYQLCQWVQMVYLVIIAILVMVDSIATVTFRWKEYGELTSSQTDATSIIFFLCPSRWVFRAICALTMATAISLRAARVMQNEDFSPHDYTCYFALTLVGLASSFLGCLINLFPFHGVPWLYDKLEERHVEDKDDVWIKFDTRGWVHPPLKHNRANESSPSALNHNDFPEKELTVPKQNPLGDQDIKKGIQTIVFGVANLLSFVALVISAFLQCYAFSLTVYQREGVEFWMNISSFVTNLSLVLSSIAYVIISARWSCHLSSIPLIVKLLAPFCLSNATSAILDVGAYADSPLYVKMVSSYVWVYLMVFMPIFYLIERCFNLIDNLKVLGKFIAGNCSEHGVTKKVVRFFDTLGSLSALVALVLGITSLFLDQYDLHFHPEGAAKKIVETAREFRETTRPVTSLLDKLIKALDRSFNCDKVFTVLGTGATVTLFASFFPGAGGVASLGSRSAYYGVRAANAFTNLARRLRKSKNLIWQVSKAVYVIQKFTLSSLKNIIKLSTFGTLVKLLPFLPPVVLGIHVLFGAFWPQRILFFSAKQRRKTMSTRFYTWVLILIILSVAISINTALVDQIVLLLSDMIPLGSISVERKLGWTLAMSASSFSLLSVVSFIVSTFILTWQTHKNHENITNSELDWKYELEKRELVTIQTAIGNKYEKRTHIKYKKERIGPWCWVLPILLCGVACGFGYLANLSPKLRYDIQPKGKFGRIIDRLHSQLDVYHQDMYDVKNDTSMECLPYATFHSVLDEYGYKNPLMSPVYKFFNETEKLIKPLRDVLVGVKKQLLMDVQEEIFGTTLEQFWRDSNLEHIGLVFLIPRLLCLVILIFGWLTASLYVCQMRIIQSLEPRKIVNAFGNVALFSMVYVLGTQFAIYNLISTFGIPFYHITIRFGQGFIFDLVADFIQISVYIGMKNEQFFAIPKRKTTVTYSIPGVSDHGPNRAGQII